MKKKVTIEGIEDGISQTYYEQSTRSFSGSIGIDPDVRPSSATPKTSGCIMPTQYGKFSGTEFTGFPMWIVSQPKTTNSYVYALDGKIHSFDGNIAMSTSDEASNGFPFLFLAYDTQTGNFTTGLTVTGGSSGATGVIEVDLDGGTTGVLALSSVTGVFEDNETITDTSTGSAAVNLAAGYAGNGMVYYNNFLYVAGNTDISQYGGLDQGGSIVMTPSVWTGSKFGLTALTDTTYPTIRSTEIPNHPMHLHTDNAVYIGDVLPTSGTTSGRGCLHRLKTDRTTIDGDTDDNSAYNVLDLPYGFLPTDIESFGTDLIIAAIQTTSTSINQGPACLFLWDTTSDTFYKQIWLPDPLVTALKTSNGITYVFSGNADSGARISAYLGGEGVEELIFSEEGLSPFAGAVDAYGDRLVFGAWTTYPETSASVMAWGSKTSRIKKAWNNIIRTSSLGTNPLVTSLRYVQQTSGVSPRLIVGWGDGTTQGLDSTSASTNMTAVWRSNPINIGKKFSLLELRFPLTGSVAANVNIQPTIYVDDFKQSYTLTAVNNTNYSGKREIVYKTPELSVVGEVNIMLQFSFTSTTIRGISFPIEMVLDVHEDSSTA